MEKLAKEVACEIKSWMIDDERYRGYDLRALTREALDYLYPRIEDSGFDWHDLNQLVQEVYHFI